HHSMFVDSDYRASSAYRKFWDSLARGEYEAGQYKRFGKDNKEIWIQASYSPILDVNGRVIKVVKYATDITQEAVKKMNAQHEMNRVLGALSSTSSCVMVADNNRVIIYMNKAVEKMLREVEGELRKA